jgi:nicotinamidase-related amidase
MSSKSQKALIVIDLQNDYFSGGKFPLWNPEATLKNVEEAIRKANELQVPVIIVQHIAKGQGGPFFNEGTEGAAVHERIKSAAPNAPVVVKEFADSFHNTTLDPTLQSLHVTDLLVCGMMTQNCVTHTAISKAAEKYNSVTVLADCCTTVNEAIHNIALHGMSTRVPLKPFNEAL